MGRPLRAAAGGYIYHVLNRANARMTIFEHEGDFEAFEQILLEAVERTEMRLLAYSVMPNHWHLVVWPRKDGELSQFVGWLTLTHTQRWHAHRHSTGSGHVYQGRFKSFPVADDAHFLTLARYVERNALRAGLVRRAEQWRWSSLYRWLRGTPEDRTLLSTWPLPRRPDSVKHVNRPLSRRPSWRHYEPARVAAVRSAAPPWSDRAVRRLNLESTIRPQGTTPKTKKRFLTPLFDRGRDRRCRRPPAQIRT